MIKAQFQSSMQVPYYKNTVRIMCNLQRLHILNNTHKRVAVYHQFWVAKINWSKQKRTDFCSRGIH